MGNTSGAIEPTKTISDHGVDGGLTAPTGTGRTGAIPTSAMATIAEHRGTGGGRRPTRRLRTGAYHSARWIVTAAAIGLVALSLALAAPAAAKGPHAGGGAAHHSASRVVHAISHAPSDATRGSTASPRSAERSVANARASDPTTASGPALQPGHDKCKKSKGDRGYPPWCTDPSAGWMGSTLQRAEQPAPARSAVPGSARPAAPVVRRHAVA